MTIIATVGASSLVATLPAGAPLIGLAAGAGVTLLGQLVGTGPLATVGGAIGGSTAASALYGAAWSGTVSGAATGGVAGLAASTAILSGPLGYLVLGSDVQQGTRDCWKAVYHETDQGLSAGKLLRDVCSDARIREVIVKGTFTLTEQTLTLPEIKLKNIWNETFLLQYILHAGELSLHGVKVE